MIEGPEIGPETSPCHAAACRREKIEVADLEADSRWSEFRERALANPLYRDQLLSADGRLTTILSMWFQDLWNYDFRRTEMCVIPYGTQEGEISFCAYNTGVGWRNIIEEMRQVATTKDWFAEKGRHQIYAGDRPVELPTALKRKLPVVAVEAGNGNGSEHPPAPAGGNGNGRVPLPMAGDAPAKDDSPTQPEEKAQGGCGSGCGCH